MELCNHCEEYHVEYQPTGSGERIPTDDGKGTIYMCEHCSEYSIKVVMDEENTNDN